LTANRYFAAVVLTLLLEGAAAAGPDPSLGVCSTESEDSDECGDAKAALADAKARVKAISDRVSALELLTDSVRAVELAQQELAADMKQPAHLLADLAIGAKTSREAFDDAAHRCKVMVEQAEAYQQAGEGYRDAVRALAVTTSNAKRTEAASVSQAAQGVTDERRAALSTAADQCSTSSRRANAAVRDQVSGLDAFEARVSDVEAISLKLQTLLTDAILLNRQVPSSGTERLNNGLIASRSSGEFFIGWFNKVRSQRKAARESLSFALDYRAPPVGTFVDAEVRLFVRADSLAYWRISAPARANWCGMSNVCKTALTNATKDREAALRTADVEGQAIRDEIQQLIADAKARSAKAADAASVLSTASAVTADASVFPRSPTSLGAGIKAIDLDLEKALVERRDSLKVLRDAELLAFGTPTPATSATAPAPASESYPTAAVQAPSPPTAVATAHAHQFVNESTPPKPKYAAYTLVYFPVKHPDQLSPELSARYEQMMASILGQSTADWKVDDNLKPAYNLFCIPSSNPRARNEGEEKNPLTWVLPEYDYGYAESMLMHASAGAVVYGLLNAGTGPYLLTTFGAPANDRAAGKRFIFADLTSVKPNYLFDLIKEYETRFQSPPSSDPQEKWEPSFSRRFLLLVDNVGWSVAQLTKTQGSGLLGAVSGNAKQAFLRLKQ
jgi:hypothetical protein